MGNGVGIDADAEEEHPPAEVGETELGSVPPAETRAQLSQLRDCLENQIFLLQGRLDFPLP